MTAGLECPTFQYGSVQTRVTYTTHRDRPTWDSRQCNQAPSLSLHENFKGVSLILKCITFWIRNGGRNGNRWVGHGTLSSCLRYFNASANSLHTEVIGFISWKRRREANNALGHNMNDGSQTFRDLCPQRGNYFTVPLLLFVNVVVVACYLCSLNVHLLSCKIGQESWLQPTHRVYLEVIRHKAKYSSWAVLSLVNFFHSEKWPTISQGRWAKHLCLLDSCISTVKSLMHKQWAAYQWAGRYFGSLSLMEGILEIKAPLMPRCLLCNCYWGPVTSISFCFYNTNKGTKVFAQ